MPYIVHIHFHPLLAAQGNKSTHLAHILIAIRPHHFMEVVNAGEVTETLKRKSEFETLQKYNRTPDKVKNSYHHLCY